MFRSSIRALRTLSAVLLLATPCMAQKPTVSEQSADDRLTAYEILPASSQAVVWIPDGDELVDGWQATQLYALASDESVAPFFEEQRQELEKRLVDAGWRLNVKPEDLSSYSEGQIALAWTAIDNPRKPFGLAMIADVAQDSAANQKLLSKIESELLGREARQTRASYAGVEITKYTLPKKAGELLAEDSYYAIVDG